MVCKFKRILAVWWQFVFKQDSIYFGRLGTPLPANDVTRELNCAKNNEEAPRIAGVDSYFKRHEISITCCHWQVL